jgi:hypothetical protein
LVLSQVAGVTLWVEMTHEIDHRRDVLYVTGSLSVRERTKMTEVRQHIFVRRVDRLSEERLDVLNPKRERFPVARTQKTRSKSIDGSKAAARKALSLEGGELRLENEAGKLLSGWPAP